MQSLTKICVFNLIKWQQRINSFCLDPISTSTVRTTVTTSTATDGWEDFGRHSYLLNEELLNWHDARKKCNEEKAELASVASSEENDFIVQVLKGINWAWIGGNDLDVEMEFAWSDGSQWNFTMWYPGEPSGGSENCVNIASSLSRRGKWNDFKCNNVKESVCKRDKEA